MGTDSLVAAESNLMLLTSREAILDLQPVLQALAERSGQCGAMHWLSYFLDRGLAGNRVPVLVLLLQPERDPGYSLCVDDLLGAALFFEYRFLGVSVGVYSTGDAGGFDRVIAPAAKRTEVAAIAMRELMRRGARIVLATYEGHKTAQPREVLGDLPNLQAATRQRYVERSLPLASTLDETLARLGKHTRFNLRYYRRRLQKLMKLTYISEAAPLLNGTDIEELNARSLNPVPKEEFARRVRSASTLPGSFLCGLQGPDGEWLSLAGGWRQNRVTVLHWQLNTAGYEKHSLTTVMRSFLLEAEIARGAQQFIIYGGTQHSMHHSFAQRPVADLIVRRRGLATMALCQLARLFAKPNGLLGRSNFFACTLLDRSLEWVPGKHARRPNPIEEFRARHFNSVA